MGAAGSAMTAGLAMAPRQTGPAVILRAQRSTAAERQLSGVSSFAFQGTNAHLLLGPVHTSFAPLPAASPILHRGSTALLDGLATAAQATHWHKSFTSVLPPAHSLVRSVHINSQQRRHEAVFVADLAHPSAAWLRDHIVGGRIVVPGACYLEAALAAAKLATLAGSPISSLSLGADAGAAGSRGGQPSLMAALQNVSIRAPLILAAPIGRGGVESSVPMLSISVDLQAGSFSIASQARTGSGGGGGVNSAATTVHVDGSICCIPAAAALSQPPSSVDPGVQLSRPARCTAAVSADACRARATEPLDASRLYADLAEAGLQYGPAFRCLDNVHTSAQSPRGGAPDPDTSCWARISPQAASGPAGSFLVHPASLDCAFQLGAAVGGGDPGGKPSGSVTFVPAALSLFYISPRPLMGGDIIGPSGGALQGGDDGGLVAVARCGRPPSPALPPSSSAPHSSAMFRDLTLFGPSGEVMACVVGLESRPIGGAHRSDGATTAAAAASQQLPPGSRLGASGRGAEEEAQLDCLYEVSWQVEGPDEARTGGQIDGPGISAAAVPDRAQGGGCLTLAHPLAGCGCDGSSADGGMGMVLSKALQLLQVASQLPSATGASGPTVRLACIASGTAQGPTPGGLGPSAAGSSPSPLSSALQGLLRTVGREVPGLHLDCHQSDPNKSAAGAFVGGGQGSTLSVSNISSGSGAAAADHHQPFDGYGSLSSAGARSCPRLLRSSAAAPAPMPFQLVPSPRGSLSSLVPSPLALPLRASANGSSPAATGAASYVDGLAPGTALLAVRAVGLNFRDVLNVSLVQGGGVVVSTAALLAVRALGLPRRPRCESATTGGQRGHGEVL